mmetsp:Transcript_12609/g.18920  ORF Transcript_12609/g.18920 Transcript_12609/m.18920 type:complete len:481 (+) Transcript_12609:417-1859(+)|eukprot:CAMPEP_0196807758 /NCGR_PEP_ID=MMETSP1362-20130617/7754_1 /TAXON_ID=163516 /ORGANISM="Leptocylindrus danicus, Strain CCMP1856" /LENGTH=480 /DNA_ID=CAMNT_0042181815 /DNA_START=402 /DNA_END=1844 /DNA_ORIENTATION=-
MKAAFIAIFFFKYCFFHVEGFVSNPASQQRTLNRHNRPLIPRNFKKRPAFETSEADVKFCDGAYFEYLSATEQLRDTTSILAKAEMEKISAEASAVATEATLTAAKAFYRSAEANAHSIAESASAAAFVVDTLQTKIFNTSEVALSEMKIDAFSNWAEEKAISMFNKAAIKSGELSTAAGLSASIAAKAAEDMATAVEADTKALNHLRDCTRVYKEALAIYTDACDTETRAMTHAKFACQGTKIIKSLHLSPPPLQLGPSENWESIQNNGDILSGPGANYRKDPSLTVILKKKVDTLVWEDVERLSDADPNNPIVMWQIVENTSEGKELLVMHRRKFLEEDLSDLNGVSAEIYAKNAHIFKGSNMEASSPIYFRTDIKGWTDDVTGTYECTYHDNGGGKSDWHHVVVQRDEENLQKSVFKWTNRAGVSWKLTPHSFPMLATGEDCPYFNKGYISCPIVRDLHGKVVYLVGPSGEHYKRIN